MLDQAAIGMAYATGSFGDLRIEAKDRVSFLFLGPRRWRVRVRHRPGLRLPLDIWSGVRRPCSFHAWLEVDRV